MGCLNLEGIPLSENINENIKNIFNLIKEVTDKDLEALTDYGFYC